MYSDVTVMKVFGDYANLLTPVRSCICIHAMDLYNRAQQTRGTLRMRIPS